MKPLTFLTMRERVLGWASVVLFVALFPLFVAWLFVSPGHGIGAAWKPTATHTAGVALLLNAGAFVVAGCAYLSAHRRSRGVMLEREHLSCIFCGYDARGLALPGRCSECGQALADTEAVRSHWRREYPPDRAQTRRA